MKQVIAVGRRKTAIARVYLREGEDKIVINHRAFEEYFPLAEQRAYIIEPLKVTKFDKNTYIYINIIGGGIRGQAGAIRHGIARALEKKDEKYRKILREHKMLTRDSRMVERKKYGRRGARRKFQFSKR